LSSICPVCNGMQELQTNCPVCSQRMCDHGKLSDLLGPYSPYEMNNTSLTNQEGDEHELCLHLLNCPDCHSSYTLQIRAELNF
jgi:uncharacterized protein YbaR (Trm112 family)